VLAQTDQVRALGLLTALAAWYTSAAGVINGMRGSALLPAGKPFGMSPASLRPFAPDHGGRRPPGSLFLP